MVSPLHLMELLGGEPQRYLSAETLAMLDGVDALTHGQLFMIVHDLTVLP